MKVVKFSALSVLLSFAYYFSDNNAQNYLRKPESQKNVGENQRNLIEQEFVADLHHTNQKKERKRVNIDKKSEKNYDSHFNILEQESVAELYYTNQKKERNAGFQAKWDYANINPNFPCLLGENVLGDKTQESITDGHKYSCGLHKIKGPPIVYSFGSNKQQDFECSVLRIREDAKVYVFEMKPENLPDPAERNSDVNFFNIAVGYGNHSDSNVPFMSIADIMKKFGHSYIDILKIDVESAEWEILDKEEHIFERVGQLLIELHAYTWCPKCSYDHFDPTPMRYIERLESRGMRVFHKELNFLSSNCCGEFSLIQKNWFSFDSYNKTSFGPL